MKKTTIALLTAAAMGTSGAVVAANHGPNFSGDVRVIYSEADDAISTNRVKLNVSGSADAMAGTEAFYFVRFNAEDGVDVDGEANGVSRDYGFVGLRGDFGEVQAGSDDDLIYKFVGARTDLFRAQVPSTDANGFSLAGGSGETFSNNVQYSVSVDAFSVAALVDTAESDNIDTTQVAVGYDFGMGDVGIVYSDFDASDNSEIYVGASLNLDVATVSGFYGQNNADNSPYSLAVSGPLTGNISYQLAYADGDGAADDAATIAQVIFDLGGGLETFANYRTGDQEDGFVLGAQYNF